MTDQREMEAAVGVAALKARICEAIVLVLTALVRQAQRLLAGEAEPTMGAQYGQLARLALEDLEGLCAQALRLVYRLLVTETLERAGLLGVEDPFGEREQLTAGAEAPAYRLWRGLQQRWALLRAGCRRRGLTLAPYPGRLFDPATTPYLEALPLPDAPLAQILALFKSVPLAAQVSAETGWIWPPAALYEDLLAYEPRLASEPLCEVQDRGRRFVLPARLTVPSVGCDGRRFSPVARPIRTISPGDLYLAPGSGRKSSGSYSTPPALVSYLVRRTLEPLVKGCRGVEEVLALRVVDPAMGTGAFLVAACDYLARACVCSSGAAEAPQEATCEESLLYRRLVVERCLSGVDFDELAVELSRYVRASGLYPAQRAALGGGKASGGDLNSYKLFVDRSYRLLRPGGHAGLVVPASLYTDQSSTGLRRLLLEEGRLLVLLGFENRAALFPIDSRCKFALLVFARERPQPTAQVRAAFMLRDPAVLESDEERFTIRLPYALIARFAPETLSLLELRTQGEADLLSRIYGARPLLGEQQAEEEADAWSVMLAREFDLTSDRSLFNRAGQGWPLYEGKTIHQYCASFAAPRYYVLPAVGLPALLRSELARLERTLDALARERWPQLLPDSGRHERVAALLAAHGRGPLSARDVRLDCEVPRLAFRRVASGTNERSLIATILPTGCFLGNTLTYVRPWRLDRDRLAALLSAGPAQPLSRAYEPALSPLQLACLCGLLNSFVLDYVIRRKITVDLTMFQVRQLPVPHFAEDQPHCRAIARRVARLVCLDPAFQALRGQLLGSEDAPVLSLARRQERQQLQNEIDAIVAHLYGLSASDLRDLLFAPQSFPLVAPAIKEGVLRAFSAVERWLERE